MEFSQSNSESDINTIIVKITSGLRSKNLGLQCEAIAEFSNLVKKHPFPVTISPIFVQIINAFYDGPNYVRLIVLNSCKSCLEHIGKLSCAEDIIGNLSLVMVSNDPCARSVCLKLLGILHPIFSANKSVHHMIILALDSHYDIELNAAIEASNAYAPISKDFASGLCQKLCTKLESLSTDLNSKIQLIKLARYLHHDAETIEETRKCLISLLSKYRSLEFVISIVDTLTILTTKSSIHARSHIEVLIEQIRMENREPAVIAILNNKLILARSMSHIWNEDHISFLCRLYHKTDSIKKHNLDTNCKIIEILSVLAESSCPSSIFRNEKSKNPILTLIIECASAAALIESDKTQTVYRINYFGIKLLTLISTATRDRELAQHTLNTFFVNVGNLWQKCQLDSQPYMFLWNNVILKLLDQFPDLFSPFLTKNLSYLTQELQDGKHRNNIVFSQFCRFMTKCCLNLPRNIDHQLPTAMEIIDSVYTKLHERCQDQYLAICSFIFQLANCEGGLLIDEDAGRRLIEWVTRSTTVNDCWLMYRVGRLANRYNQHAIASVIYNRVLSSVISPYYIYWIRGLIDISQAEALLMSFNNDNNQNNGLIDAIMTAQKHFYQATNSFKCSGSSLWWQDAYVRIRCEFLDAVYILVVTLNQYGRGNQSTMRNMALSALDENKTLFKNNIAHICDLISKSIDADHETIEHLQRLKQLSTLFLQTLQNHGRFVDMSLNNGNSHQDYWLRRLRDEISINYTHSKSNNIDDNHDMVDKIRLLVLLAMNCVKIGIPLPRFMFQKLQNTEVRLMAIVNGKSISNESNIDVVLRQNQSHKVHVFGLIQQKCKIGQPIRLVNNVKISISLQSYQLASKVIDSTDRPVLIIDKTDKLTNDYFSSHILLDLKKYPPNKYQLIIKAIPIDTHGTQWETRDVTSCVIKVESPFNGSNVKIHSSR